MLFRTQLLCSFYFQRIANSVSHKTNLRKAIVQYSMDRNGWMEREMEVSRQSFRKSSQEMQSQKTFSHSKLWGVIQRRRKMEENSKSASRPCRNSVIILCILSRVFFVLVFYFVSWKLVTRCALADIDGYCRQNYFGNVQNFMKGGRLKY